jgi:hypothetical protein
MTPTTAAQLLRSLSNGDESSLAAVVCAAMGWAGPRQTGLDRSTHVLVELAALFAADAPTTSVRWAVERAAATGVNDEQLVGVLLAAGRATGEVQTVACAPRLALALDLDTDVEVD